MPPVRASSISPISRMVSSDATKPPTLTMPVAVPNRLGGLKVRANSKPIIEPGPPRPRASTSSTSTGSGAWKHPGTRLGLWSHFTTQFTGTVFALMWGFPFLIAGEGVSRETASALLTVFVLTGMAAGPLIGVLVQRHPMRRSWLVLGVISVNATGWGLVLVWPGQAPLPILVLLVLALGLGGPGSMIGFEFARTFNPPQRLGTATGIVNVGGFVASLLTILLVGLILDARTGGTSDYDIGDFKVAMSVQYLIGAVGVIGILRTRRLARRRLAEDGIFVRPLRDILAERRGFSPDRAGKDTKFTEDRETVTVHQRRT